MFGLSVALIRKIESLSPDIKDAMLSLAEEFEKHFATSEDIKEIKADIKRLSEAVAKLIEFQARAEERFTKLEEAVIRMEERLNKLEEIVAKMNERLTKLEEIVAKMNERLTIAEERLTKVEERLAKLEEAVIKIDERLRIVEERLEKLEESQRRLEESQKRLEESQKRLEESQKRLEDRVESFSHSLGYSLEDRALWDLPYVLPKFGIEVEGRLTVKRVLHGNKRYEINIYGLGKRDGKRVLIFGECKTRMSKTEADRLLKLIERLGKTLMEEEKAEEVIAVAVSFRISDEVWEYLKDKGIIGIESHELRPIYL